ncbi:HAD family hydrolase [Chengkuizengella axinellae]|uniref:HAD family phosphatase n=1 Tax=Chengkuizengella axinellae TaxID=3064388 RepID=A0ABT9IUV7_9BACL|nr:HAD family phosphatase [Chengkuizengella sp. 2205SS18-9]MDP5272837.1 HAD family phosphatase [Chengkuizengella sp. 2205SS18-9]
MEAVIFDMDGVIIDSHTVTYQLLSDTANQYGCNLTPDKIKGWGSLSARQFWKRIKDEYHLEQSLSELIESYDVEKEIQYYEHIGLIPGFKEVLEQLNKSNIKTAIATSANKRRMNAVVDIFELRTLFDAFVCDDEVINSKPDPSIFIRVAQKLKVAPEKCLVVEDSENGKIAAQKAGMKCLGFKGLPHVNENMEGSDLMIRDFKELNIDVLYVLFDS